MSHPGLEILPPSELRLASTLPEPDARVLTQLSDASQARAWIQRKMEDYNNHASTLLAIHNSIAQINTLPTEIFQEILVHIPSEASWCDALWMMSLGSVCRHWRSVLLATPEYWLRGLHTVMDPIFYDRYEDEDLTHGRNLFLARSAPCPLEITMAYSSVDFGQGWYAFDDHFDRITVFEVTPSDSHDLDDIFDMMLPWSYQNMKRLERLKLDGRYVKASTKRREQWEAEGVPHLRHLEITSDLFCRATTVPSLHTVILMRPPRDIRSLPQLLNALENCPVLATLRLELAHKDDTFQNMTLKRVLDLPKLRNLAVGGGLSDVRCFLTALSFPSTTLVELDVLDTGNEQDKGLVLPNVLPRSPSIFGAHPMIEGVDRLCFHSKHQVRSEDEHAIVSMRAYIQGKERLRISPAFWLHSADHFLQILKLFRECRVTELALDLRYAAGDMDGEFWPKFFKALPDVLRLQLLSPTAESRAMKREIAKYYLSSCGVPHLVPENSLVDFICRIALPRLAVSLAWVLPCVDYNDVVRMDELEDVLQVLMGHTDDEAIALQRLELYLTTLTPDPSGQQAFDVKEACPDGMPSRVIDSIRIPGSRGLEDAAEVVVFGSPLWEFRFAENDHEPDVEGTDDERMVVDDD
ncbi:hypothetical protein V8D89_009940 [Ganoderma adspersum]